MINYTEETIKLGEHCERIIHFAVWFQTPFGLCKTLGEAKSALADRNMSDDMLVPVAVAVGETLYECVGR